MIKDAAQTQSREMAFTEAAVLQHGQAMGHGRWDGLRLGNLPRLLSMPMLILALITLPLLTLKSVQIGHEVVERLEGLSTAATDNMQWVLSQAEVDHLKLQAAVDAVRDPMDLPKLRRQFDIYYSRIDTFLEGPLFTDLRTSVSGGALLTRLVTRLEALVELIDVEDAQLMNNRDAVQAELQQNGDDVRELALLGVVIQVEDTESKRLELFTILWRLALVVLALIVALAITALLMGWMYRVGRGLAKERSKAASRMEAMIASSLDAILMVDKEGRILAFNGAAEAIFGYARDEAIGASMEKLIIPHHLREAHRLGMQRFLKTSVPRVAGQGRIQLEALHKSGEIFPVELSISISRSKTDLVFVSFIRDISERVAAEEELRRARDDALAGERAKANMLTVMSHEMRTPLTGVLGAIDLLQNTGPNAEQSRYLNAMQVSGELLLHHVNDVLQLSSLEAGMAPENLRPFNLRDLMTGLVESQKANAKSRCNTLTLDYNIQGSDLVAGRPRVLQQALINLIGNAIKFTRDGAIMVDVQHSSTAGQIEFHVSDTGEGIAHKDLKRIFEDFITLDSSFGRGSEGTGLGLAITRRIIEAMGGTITCESELGEGSLFSVILPLPTAQAAPTSVCTAEPALTEPARLLVVEDNDINRELLQQILQRQGHLVTVASGGAEAVEICKQQRFDLILMDISMPEVDGIEAIRRIRLAGLAEGVDIVALTAHTAPEDHARILKAGFAEVVTKPITGQALAVLIDRRAKTSTGAQGPSETSDIDQFFEALGNDRARGFLQAFVTEVDAFVAELKAASSLSDAHRKEAHRLAGSAAVLGLTVLRPALIEIETQPEADLPVLADLQKHWLDARALVSQHLS